MKIKLTLEEKIELDYAIQHTKEFYKQQLNNMLEIRDKENVETNIEYWRLQIEKLEKVRTKLQEMNRKGEL